MRGRLVAVLVLTLGLPAVRAEPEGEAGRPGLERVEAVRPRRPEARASSDELSGSSRLGRRAEREAPRRAAIARFLDQAHRLGGADTTPVDAAIPFEFAGTRAELSGAVSKLGRRQLRMLGEALTRLPPAIANPDGKPLAIIVEDDRGHRDRLSYDASRRAVIIGSETFDASRLDAQTSRYVRDLGGDAAGFRRFIGMWARGLFHEAVHHGEAVDPSLAERFRAVAYTDKARQWRTDPEVKALTDELSQISLIAAFVAQDGKELPAKYVSRRDEVLGQLQTIYDRIGLPSRYGGDLHAAPDFLGYRSADQEYFAIGREILFADGVRAFLRRFSRAELELLRATKVPGQRAWARQSRAATAR